VRKIEHDPFKANFDNLEEFADRISEVLHCPITIEDANHRLIAYSTHDERTDAARVATIIGRRVPEKVINNLWKEGIIPALLQTNQPVRVRTIDEIGLGDRVAISIWKDEEVLGFIWAIEINKRLSPDELDLLKKAAEAVKNKLLQLQIRKYKKVERSQEFLWKLLTGHIQSEKEMLESFHQLQITPPSSFSVTVFRFAEEIGEEAEKQISYILQTTQRLKVQLYTIDYNNLILLVSLDSIPQPSEDLTSFVNSFSQKMKERFGIREISAGFGNIYEACLNIQNSYQEALKVLAIKKMFPYETTHIYSYHHLGIYQFLDVILEKKKADNIRNSSFEKLKIYDQKHHSDLVESFETFLDKDMNINEAAKALNVHVNTLSYRLKRISEIGDVNLKDYNQKIMLYIDIKIEKGQS